jgi:uncharacterized protein (DUF302 family)
MLRKKKKGRLLPVEKYVYNTRIGKSYKTIVYINPDKLKPKYKLSEDVKQIYTSLEKKLREDLDFALTMKTSICGI